MCCDRSASLVTQAEHDARETMFTVNSEFRRVGMKQRAVRLGLWPSIVSRNRLMSIRWTMSVLSLFLSVLLSALATAGGSCSPGFTVVSFTTFTASPSSSAVCAETTNEAVTTVNGQTLENCANSCAFDQSCAGFNHKNSSDPAVCHLFAGLPTTFTISPHCTYYEVFSRTTYLLSF